MPISWEASAIVVNISGMFYSASAISSKCEKKWMKLIALPCRSSFQMPFVLGCI